MTGSRDWSNTSLLDRVIRRAFELAPTAILVHGACRGVDEECARVWGLLGGVCEAHPADWNTHGRVAGPLRNEQMIQTRPDVCLAFILDASRGASHCALLAERAGIPTFRFEEPR